MIKKSKKISNEFLKILNENKEIIFKTYSKETSYLLNDINFLWEDLEKYLTFFSESLNQKKKIWNLEKNFYQKFEKKCEYQRVKHGKVLLVLPYNAIIPLLPIFILSFCIFGNELIVAPSRKSLKTVTLIYSLLKKILDKNDFKVFIFKKGGEDALKRYIDKIDLLFFQGSSKKRDLIYAQCLEHNTDIIYEGEGAQVTVIEDNVDAEKIKQWLSFCHGKLCTTPKIFFIKKNLYKNFFKIIKKNISHIQFTEFNQKKIIESVHLDEVFIGPFEDLKDLVFYLKRRYSFGLQISVFSKKPKIIEEFFLNELNISRITININPTYQNSLLPWGGYKKSGYSRVGDFFDKATRTVIVEKV